MRVVLQRVSRASVHIDNQMAGEIEKGVVLLLGVQNGDSKKDAVWLAEKCVNLRIFENDAGKFHYSLLDIQGEVLAVSQFTLLGDSRKGRRPSFSDAAEPETAKKLYLTFVDELKKSGLKVATGVFAAMMQVDIHNDGPVTLIIDSPDK